MTVRRVLVTGATGFVGSALCGMLNNNGWSTVASARRFSVSDNKSGDHHLADIGPDTSWGDVLQGVEAVVHLAARVHVMQERTPNPLDEFRRVNTYGTLHLAKQAAAVGVRRFVYLSSIKVNGEATCHSTFTENDPPAPEDPYAVSKYEAELGLRNLAEESGLELIIIRPPLVYGPGVKGNFARLLQLLDKGWPLPLGSINNKRSLLALDNLASGILFALEKSDAAGELLLLSDGEDISTPQLIRTLATYMHRAPRLLPVSPKLLKLAAHLMGKQAMVERLAGSLQIDSSKARSMGWIPPVSLDKGLEQVVRWYMSTH